MSDHAHRVLVVDDDRQITRALDVRLRAAGYDVEIAHDGVAGLVAVAEMHPSAVVLDIRMPILDGMGMLAKLREQQQTRQIPVIMLSACAVDERKALDAGAYCFISKPYNPDTLLTTVDAALKYALDPQTHQT